MTKKERRKKKLIQARNRKLIKKYPWLKPRNVWSGKVLDNFDYTFINWGWSKGWDAAFGMMYLKELGEAVKEAGLEKIFMIEQQKEKYGRCVNYVVPVTEKINRIISKYEYLSENICYYCGKPDVCLTNEGWIIPMCPDCYKKQVKRREAYIYESKTNRGEEPPTPRTDEEIAQRYEEICCDEGKMCDTYTIRRFSTEGPKDEVYDVSETAQKIRDKWERRHKR